MNAKRLVVSLLSGIGFLVASCGGGESDSSVAVGGNQGGATAQPAPLPTGNLRVAVADGDGRPLHGAVVYVLVATGYLMDKTTDQGGEASFAAVPEQVTLQVHHPIGDREVHLIVKQSGSTVTTVIVEPYATYPVALFPASIASISADRMEVELHLSLAGSAGAEYPFPMYGENVFPDPENPLAGEVLQVGPIFRVGDCTFRAKAWRTRPGSTPECYRKAYPPGSEMSGRGYSVVGVRYAYDPLGNPAFARSGDPYAAMLLLDQSERALQGMRDSRSGSEANRVVAAYLQNFAARLFIHRALNETKLNQVAVAGFAGPAASASTPPLIPVLPVWTTPFLTDTTKLDGAADDLESKFGGSAPVLLALKSALNLTAQQVPLAGNRMVVAMLSGGDDGVFTALQSRAELQALRSLRTDTGIKAVLVSSRESVINQGMDIVEGKAPSGLAEISASLSAPLVFSPNTWPTSHPYAGMGMASDLVAGKAMPTIDLFFRLRTDDPAGFAPGSTITDTLKVVQGDDGWGYDVTPLPFSVEIP